MAVNINFDTPIQYLKGVGEARAAAFRRLDVEKVGDLLTFYPRKYEERGRVITIAEALNGELCSVEVTVRETTEPKRVRGNMTIFRSTVYDDSGSLDLIFFNTPYTAKALTPGRKYRVYGTIKVGLYNREMTSPKLEPILWGQTLPYYVPIYRLSPPLTQKVIMSAVDEAMRLCDNLQEILPDEIREKYGLMPRSKAVRIMHRPETPEELFAARRSLAFAEIAVFRLALSRMRSVNKEGEAHSLGLKNTGIKHFFSQLPFELTNAQKNAVKDIFGDMEKENPMARLLQGDVGSGKTAVAAAAIYLCVKNGFQACMMAPTEILATQHKKTLDKFLAPFGIRVELLISGLPAAEKRRVREGLKDGSIHVAVGTHALITDDTAFANCALAVADEQHRFGVKQRAAMLEKSENNGKRAHMLVMSATPIPRSLSLILFGDLDVSVLNELPPGRQKIETSVVSQGDPEIYKFVRKEIQAGGRAYVVCSLIEENENTSTQRRAAESYFEELTSGPLSGIPAGLLHGKMKPSEKAAVMADFASGKTKVLVSTTVIEVGVDVPEATVMVVENAECFGLSQLHQLRGRIGRGNRKSYCILVNGSSSPVAAERLSIMRRNSDGFKIAEADLERRGPGDFFGERQSGEFSFACAAISDMRLLTDTDELMKDVVAHRDDPAYDSIFKATNEFIERTKVGLTVN